MKDNIIDGDILWAIEVYIDFIFDSIEEVHSDGYSERVPAEASEGETLGPIDSTLLGVTDSSKLGKWICCKSGTLLFVSDWSVEGISGDI